MKKLLLILFLIPISLNAQSISIGHSVKFWGSSEEFIDITAKYKGFGFHIYKNYTVEKWQTKYEESGLSYRFKNKNVYKSTLAISYTPIKTKYLNLGGIFSNNNFPTYNDIKIHFYIEGIIPINKVSIVYKHISNGFGLFHKPNYGIDTLSIQYNF